MDKCELSFVEECEENWLLESRFFPSKVGGKPAWLNLKDLPAASDVECRVCKEPCVFLCQVYAPYDEDPEAFHRTVYVFVCKNGACCRTNNNDNIRVLRCQLPRANEFYPYEAPVEVKNWRPDIRAEKWTKTCQICGISAPSHCAKCKSVYYCCRSHQLVDWKGGHKQQCKSESPDDSDTPRLSAACGKILFPEYELTRDVQEESHIDNENDEADLEKEKKEMEFYEKLVKSGKAGTLQSEEEIDTDLHKMAQGEQDETFAKFKEKIKGEPDQVLRYHRGGEPLYVSSAGRAENIPKCDQCNGERDFEFQIMPQMLTKLKLGNILTSIDWGTLLIFTCRSSCVPKTGYVPEYIWKQDIV